MRLLVLRSAWGLGAALKADAPRALSSLRAAGYQGLEASLADIGDTRPQREAFVREARAQVPANACVCGRVCVRVSPGGRLCLMPSRAHSQGVHLILSAYSSWNNCE